MARLPPQIRTVISLKNRLTHRSFQPYMKAIGETAVSWNNLQEELADLFRSLVLKEASGDLGISLTIWHSIENDRTQRKILINVAARVKSFGHISTAALAVR